MTIEQLIELERVRMEVFKVGKGRKRIYMRLPLRCLFESGDRIETNKCQSIK